MPMTLEQFGLDKLSDDQKREVAALLEENFAPPPREPWETPEFLAELQRRAAEARANSGSGVPWEDVYQASLARCQARRDQ